MPRIVIIGAGPGGICMGIKLLAAGINDFIILEKAPAIGGTWWYNRYPGAACDVPSHLYSFSFELKRDWSSPYAAAPEILDYVETCARKYHLLPHIRLNTEVTAASWNHNTQRWRVSTARNDDIECAVLIAAQGMFNELHYPDIAGLNDFHGACFHTARWDHAIDFTNKRVGLIGSAASAVQCAPQIAERARALTMFQRTPNWILPKGDAPYSPHKLAYLTHAPDAVEQRRVRLWNEFDGFGLLNDVNKHAEAIAQGLANIAIVEKPEVRAKLTPNYSFGCKRVLLSSNYYQTFNRENVSLITAPVASVSPNHVHTADGGVHALDVLVLATGFKVSRYASSIRIIGRDDRALADAWRDGAHAYFGIASAGFPNFFQIYGPNTNKGTILFMIECQTAYIVRQLLRMQRENLAWLDVKPEVMARYDEGIQRDANSFTVWAENCNNYFRHPVSGRIVTQYPRTLTQYRADTLALDDDAYRVG